MVGACLFVIACIVALAIADQKNDHDVQIRARGISIARLLSGLPTDQLVESETYESMLQLVSFSQGTEDFAYAALVNVSGGLLAEVSGPGVIVPSAPIRNVDRIVPITVRPYMFFSPYAPYRCATSLSPSLSK